MTNPAYAIEYDYESDREEELLRARADAKETIINTLLSDEPVNFSYKETWTLEEVLDNYLNIPSHKLDQFIQHEQEGMY